MNILKKIKYSACEDKMTLHREGLFYKCYNSDAMVFAQCVRPYKVSARHVKLVGDVVLSLGFPASVVDTGQLSWQQIGEAVGSTEWHEEKAEKKITFQIASEKKEDYDAYKVSVAGSAAKRIEFEEPVNRMVIMERVILKIRNFELADHSPMQGMAFLQELKNMARKIDSDGEV